MYDKSISWTICNQLQLLRSKSGVCVARTSEVANFCNGVLITRGFAKGVSRTVSPRFFLKMKRKKRKKTEKTEENGKNGKKRKKTEENGKKRKKRKKSEPEKTEENGKKRKETEKKRKETERNGQKRKETEQTEENGKKRKTSEPEKTEKNGRKRKKTEKTEKIGSDTVSATPFAKPRITYIDPPLQIFLGGFQWFSLMGEISIIVVVRAPVAILILCFLREILIEILYKL